MIYMGSSFSHLTVINTAILFGYLNEIAHIAQSWIGRFKVCDIYPKEQIKEHLRITSAQKVGTSGSKTCPEGRLTGHSFWICIIFPNFICQFNTF